jgi:hypothetical protein
MLPRSTVSSSIDIASNRSIQSSIFRESDFQCCRIIPFFKMSHNAFRGTAYGSSRG